MRRHIALIASVAPLAPLVLAHGQHAFDANDAHAQEGLSYAEKHMQSEHHIDAFDLPSFFKLHDLDNDGYWTVAEIQAVYGLNPDAAHSHGHAHGQQGGKPGGSQEKDITEKAKVVSDKVLEVMDMNRDGKISADEFIAAGTAGLPSFEGFKDLGHHYDEESEYFLHHEELYHSTPETQTDESYNHPEDIEHFKNHHHIEAEEDARERRFQGLPQDANLEKDHVAADPLDEHAHDAGQGPPADSSSASLDSDNDPSIVEKLKDLKAGDEVPDLPKSNPKRVSPGAAPNRIDHASAGDVRRQELYEAKEKAGGREHDVGSHGVPRTAEERLRAGVPYKYKMRKGLRKEL